jgi:cystathionine beta-synthase/cysteine synthase A
VVASVGTGGTITGIARRLKAYNSSIKIIGVDPVGSILGGGHEVAPYLVEGIGYDFFPDVLDNDLIDGYIKTTDADSFHMARRLIHEEGLLIGGSCGAAMWGALQAARSLGEGQNCLVILADSIRNYISKFASDDWMREHNFIR